MITIETTLTCNIPPDSPPAYLQPPAYSTPPPPVYSILPRVKSTPSGNNAERVEVLHFSHPPSAVLAADGKWFFDVQTRPGKRRKRVISDPEGRTLFSVYALPGRWLVRSEAEDIKVRSLPEGLEIDRGGHVLTVGDGHIVAEGQAVGALEIRGQSVCHVTIAPGFDMALAIAIAVCEMDRVEMGRRTKKWWRLI